ncbi:hypothetical protein P4H65_01275 [Paenibacillus chitinolyticus]|uniref:hypothetical protein n=1 Tax=Paenibacillus chitinolyticus TaxID=79263 RepID=UPI002DB842BD|nr:hypothetical protein [Paenibacillus chitinolyticus]MEC0244447.1 hypothetical protein [Paenibacillus chitinolyticus]
MKPALYNGHGGSNSMFSGERVLIWTGLAGLVLAAFMAVYVTLYGSIVLPEGNVESAFSFNAALGVFILSIAAILPLAAMGSRSRKVFRWLLAFTAGGAYLLESVQHLRGINPRFTQAGSGVDRIANITFGLDSMLLIVLIVWLAAAFYRKSVLAERPLVILGIRYGFLSMMAAVVAGIGMIVLQSRFTGTSGNLIVLHGLGFHAVQTIPLLGWLLEKSDDAQSRKVMLVHAGSLGWMLAIAGIGLQTASGMSVAELSPWTLTAAAGLLVWLLALGAALRKSVTVAWRVRPGVPKL